MRAPQGDSSTESNSESSSPSSACFTTSSAPYTLRPRLPITYDEAALSQLHGRPQVRTLKFVSIPLTSSGDESEASDTPAEVEVDSPCSNQDESPTSRAKAGLTPMTRGRVTNKMSAAKLHLQTSSGITNVPDLRLPIDDQRRRHQQSAAKVPEVPLDQVG